MVKTDFHWRQKQICQFLVEQLKRMAEWLEKGPLFMERFECSYK